nr:hypothetical protein [Tanacetum cinerariifolium]
MSSTIELSKPYDCKVTVLLRPYRIQFIKERLSKSNKRVKLFKDTVFGKYLDLDVEDNDNHLLNYVLHHQRPQLSKSIDSNIVFDIAGHTLLFGRSEFSLVTGFACGKLVFPEYMDNDIPPFLRRVFLDKEFFLENKASLGKAAKGKVAKGKDEKRKVAQGKASQPSDIGDTHNVTILDLRSLIWDDEKWKKLSVEDSIRVCLLYMSEQIFMGQEDKKIVNNSFLRLVEDIADLNPITQIRPDLKERNENWYRKMYDYVAYKERSEQVDDRNGFTRNDEPEAEQDGSGTSDRASAEAKFEETKSTREVALEEELDLWKSRYVELESYYKNLEASIEIARKKAHGLSFPTPNVKAMSVCDDIDEADAVVDDNAKAWGYLVWTGVSDVILPDPVLKHAVPCIFSCFLRSALNLGKAECSNCMFLAEKIKTLETKIKILEAILEMERHPEKERTIHVSQL